MKRALLYVTTLVLAGCAASVPVAQPANPLQAALNPVDPSTPPATKAQIAIATQTENECIVHAVVSLDDGVSPANVERTLLRFGTNRGDHLNCA